MESEMEESASATESKTFPSNLGSAIRENLHEEEEEDSTDFKIAMLSSLLPDIDHDVLLETLITSEGSIEQSFNSLNQLSPNGNPMKRKASNDVPARQSSLNFPLRLERAEEHTKKPPKSLARKGQTLYLYSAEDISRHTPCTIIHNFLPSEDAATLLKELLSEAASFGRQTFKVFDNVVQSPHSSCFYVSTQPEAEAQKTEYIYNGAYLDDVREATPEMKRVSAAVQKAVNEEIAKRIKDVYPGGTKLKYQSSKQWKPNAAFVNCYEGGAESVGYHSDQLTYLGPRAIIGSLSLGVAREFRVRKVVARPNSNKNLSGTSPKSKGAVAKDKTRADAEGQISIHLPHNSLLVMHAEMQEEWKHSIAPARSITPHSIAGNKRINVTYRWYRKEFHPNHTPQCHCGVPCVLRCVQRQEGTRGRYMWQCHAGLTGEKEKTNCNFFEWAAFTDDGEPIWKTQKD